MTVNNLLAQNAKLGSFNFSGNTFVSDSASLSMNSSTGEMFAGGFTFNNGKMLTTTAGTGQIGIEISGTKFFRINDPSASALISGRNDNGYVASFSSYGSSGTALTLTANPGVALRCLGDSFLTGRNTGSELITISGLALSYKNGNSFSSPSNSGIENPSAWVDFLVMTGNTTLPTASTCPGKILFVKCSSSYTLTVYSCKKSSESSSGTATWKDNNLRGFLSDGSYWYEMNMI